MNTHTPSRFLDRRFPFRRTLLAAIAGLSLGASMSWADIVTYNSGFANGTTIPDGNPSGWSDTRTVSGISFSSIGQISVTLNISGGSIGDYYAYLVYDDGAGNQYQSVLLNRLGRTAANPLGSSDQSLYVTLVDGAANGDVHLYEQHDRAALINVNSTFQPDGRSENPALVTDASPRDAMLDVFNGKNPNGTWTLFVADMVDDAGVSSGGTVVSWGMAVSSVPEPSQMAMTGVVLLGSGLYYLRRRQAKTAAGESGS